MNGSFYTTVMAVLNDEEEIRDLPGNKLRGSIEEGERVEASISPSTLLKLVRLQTLVDQENEKAKRPEQDEVQLIADMTQSSVLEVMADLLAGQETAAARMIMLERLMTEIVRDVIPSESDRSGVRYFIHMSKALMYRKIDYPSHGD